MDFETHQIKTDRSKFTVISLSVAGINVGWFLLLIVCWTLDIYLETASLLWLLSCPVLTLVGIFTGGIALYQRRSYIGLVVNLAPLLLLTLPILYYLLSPSYGVPPEYR